MNQIVLHTTGPQYECIGGPLDGQKLDCPEGYSATEVPFPRTPYNLLRWPDKPGCITPINMCPAGIYRLKDGKLRWEY